MRPASSHVADDTDAADDGFDHYDNGNDDVTQGLVARLGALCSASLQRLLPPSRATAAEGKAPRAGAAPPCPPKAAAAAAARRLPAVQVACLAQAWGRLSRGPGWEGAPGAGLLAERLEASMRRELGLGPGSAAWGVSGEDMGEDGLNGEV